MEEVLDANFVQKSRRLKTDNSLGRRDKMEPVHSIDWIEAKNGEKE